MKWKKTVWEVAGTYEIYQENYYETAHEDDNDDKNYGDVVESSVSKAKK